MNIKLKRPCNLHPVTPHFYIVKLGLHGYTLFSYFALKHRLWVHVYTRSMFWTKIRKNTIFTAVKNCRILHRRVIVMLWNY